MAEALLNYLGRGDWRGFSAGSAALGSVHPKAIETLKRYGIPLDQPRSKSWNKFSRHRFHCVVAVCSEIAEEAWPLFPGRPKRLYWNVPDPTREQDNAADAVFDKVFFMLKDNIEKLIGGAAG
jgi:arsenate reductase